MQQLVGSQGRPQTAGTSRSPFVVAELICYRIIIIIIIIITTTTTIIIIITTITVIIIIIIMKCQHIKVRKRNLS